MTILDRNPARETKLLLLADDSKTVRTLISKVLDRAGYQYFYFEDGAELLTFLKNNPHKATPDAILLDVEMPVMDGPTACREIRRMEPSISVPIIFFTSANSPETHTQVEMVGGDEYLVKPFAPDKLLERIDHWTKVRVQTDSYTPDTSSKLVMFADDSRTIRLGVKRVLNEVGFDFEGYETGMDLIRAMDKLSPLIIILDVNMEHMDGYDTCRMIRRTHPDLNIPVLFFTSSVEPDNVSKAREAGGDDFIKKSLPPDVLVERVEYWARQRQNAE
jgi:DNA-binding response OmpR family regulator